MEGGGGGGNPKRQKCHVNFPYKLRFRWRRVELACDASLVLQEERHIIQIIYTILIYFNPPLLHLGLPLQVLPHPLVGPEGKKVKEVLVY